MKNKKKQLAAMIAVGLVSSTGLVAAGQKIDVCHQTGNDGVFMLSVSLQALSGHERHGDYLPETYYADPDGLGCITPPGSTPDSVIACQLLPGYMPDTAPDCYTPPPSDDGDSGTSGNWGFNGGVGFQD
jgi:hypothetical protein